MKPAVPGREPVLALRASPYALAPKLRRRAKGLPGPLGGRLPTASVKSSTALSLSSEVCLAPAMGMAEVPVLLPVVEVVPPPKTPEAEPPAAPFVPERPRVVMERRRCWAWASAEAMGTEPMERGMVPEGAVVFAASALGRRVKRSAMEERRGRVAGEESAGVFSVVDILRGFRWVVSFCVVRGRGNGGDRRCATLRRDNVGSDPVEPLR